MESKKIEILDYLRRNRFVPSAALLELTYKCNFNCKHCYRAIENNSELTKKEIFSVINDLASLGCLLIGFSGGEVFLRSDFLEIAEYAKYKGFGITIFTNGSTINEENIERIKSLNPMKIQIGFYGVTNKTYTRITKNPTAKSKVMHTLKLLKKYKISFVLGGLLSIDNYNEFEKMIKLGKKMCRNINNFKFGTSVIPRFDGDTGPLSCEISEQQKRILSLNKALKKYVTMAPNKKVFCEAGISTISISPYGEVYPCTNLRISAGNIRNKSFKEIWQESKMLSILRKTLLQEPRVCNECKLNSYCTHCPAIVFLTKSNLANASCLKPVIDN